jgi:hypothetical protein
MMKVTDWLSHNTPVHEDGVYQRKFPDIGAMYSKYEDGQWFAFGETPDEAADNSCVSANQELPWRGLAADPKAEVVV